MRILMTTDTIGGVWTYTCELTTNLLQRSCTVILISVGPAPSEAQQSWVHTTSERWPENFRYLRTDFPLEWMQNGASCYAISKNFMLQCVETFQPDLFHSNQFCYGALPVEIPKLVVAHSEVHSWAEACDPSAGKPSPWLESYDALVSAGLRGADAIIAPTRWMADQILRFHAPPLDIEVIANGRSMCGLKKRSKKIQAITCGRLWDKAKNVRLLGQLTSTIPIKVAGDWENPENGQNLEMAALTFLGKLTEAELLDLFIESSIYIVTSCYEPFGLGPVEAAICGCAIVANDIPSMHEVWGDNALYFERDDASSLQRILDSLRRDPTAVERAGKLAQAHAASLYSAERMTAAYMNLYGKRCQRTVPCAS